MTALNQILKTLPTLGQHDLKQVQQRLALLMGKDAPPVTNEWLLDGFTIELRKRGLWVSRAAIPAARLPKDYSEHADGVGRYLVAGVKGQLRDDAKRVLASVACGTLIDWLAKFTPAITIRTVFANLPNVGVAMDDSYPGYWHGAAFNALIGGKMVA